MPQVRLVPQVKVDYRVILDRKHQQAALDLQEPLVHPATKVFREVQATLELLVRAELLVKLDRQVQPARLVIRVVRDSQVHLVFRVRLELRAPQVELG